MAKSAGVLGVTDRVNSQELHTIQVPVGISFGATGAPTKVHGPMTVARTAAGRYTLTFFDKYNRLLGYSVNMFYQGTATGGTWETFTQWVASTGALVLSHTVADLEADPSDGDTVDFVFTFRAVDY